MFDKFFPDEYLASTYVIPFEELYEKGYRGVIFDIDNTLVPHGAPADERAKKLFTRLNKIGFSSCLLSNNQKPRVEMFNQEIQTAYIYNAHKPSIKNYEKAMKIMGTTKERTLFVGDRSDWHFFFRLPEVLIMHQNHPALLHDTHHAESSYRR